MIQVTLRNALVTFSFTGIAMSSHAFERGGDFGAGNGGDTCENRIKIIRDDIASWMKRGGSQSLSLPNGVSQSQYLVRMKSSIASARISCTDEPITIQGHQKTCMNVKTSTSQEQIICDVKRFMQTSEEDQYVLIHHEYAGLAGFEINTSDGSQYRISNQISGYLEKQVVTKLAIRKTGKTRTGGPRYVWVKLPNDGRSICAAYNSRGSFRGMVEDFYCPGKPSYRWVDLPNGQSICVAYSAKGDFRGMVDDNYCD